MYCDTVGFLSFAVVHVVNIWNVNVTLSMYIKRKTMMGL